MSPDLFDRLYNRLSVKDIWGILFGLVSRIILSSERRVIGE